MSALTFLVLYLAAVRWIAPHPAIVVAAAPIGVACYGLVALAVASEVSSRPWGWAPLKRGKPAIV